MADDSGTMFPIDDWVVTEAVDLRGVEAAEMPGRSLIWFCLPAAAAALLG